MIFRMPKLDNWPADISATGIPQQVKAAKVELLGKMNGEIVNEDKQIH